MTTTEAPKMPTGVDILADQFVVDHAGQMSPIEQYTLAQYGKSFAKLPEQHKIATITVVTHAVQFCSFASTFQHRRAALQALRYATARLTTDENPMPRADFRAVYARFVGTLASAIAATYVEYPPIIPTEV